MRGGRIIKGSDINILLKEIIEEKIYFFYILFHIFISLIKKYSTPRFVGEECKEIISWRRYFLYLYNQLIFIKILFFIFNVLF